MLLPIGVNLSVQDIGFPDAMIQGFYFALKFVGRALEENRRWSVGPEPIQMVGVVRITPYCTCTYVRLSSYKLVFPQYLQNFAEI